MMHILAILFVVAVVVVALVVRNNKKTVEPYVVAEEAKIKTDVSADIKKIETKL